MHVGKAEVTAIVTVGELFVIDAEQVQLGGVEIMHCTHLAGPFTAREGAAARRTAWNKPTEKIDRRIKSIA